MLLNQQVVFVDAKSNQQQEGYVLQVKEQLCDLIQCKEIAEIIYKNEKGNYKIVNVPATHILCAIQH